MLSRKNEKGGAGIVALLLIIIIIAVGTVTILVVNNSRIGKSTSAGVVTSDESSVTDSSSEEPSSVEPEKAYDLITEAEDYTQINSKKIGSDYAILLDATTNEIIAGLDYDKKIYPASLTKMMTLLVAVENIDDLDATYTFDSELIDDLIEQEAARVGFEDGEKATMLDMLYGTVLRSGADATTGLAISVAGSEKDFAKLMNEKATELGLQTTYYANASGLHLKNHVSSCKDIAVVMQACLENETCKKILSTESYTTKKTTQHPDGIEMFSLAFADIYSYGVDTDYEINGGKTGYTDEAGCLLATYLGYKDHTYILITANAKLKNETVEDAEYIYRNFVLTSDGVKTSDSSSKSDDSSSDSDDTSADT